MKRIFKSVLIFMCSAMLFIVTACGSTVGGDAKTASVRLEATEVVMRTGDERKLGVTVDPASSETAWISDDPETVSVDGEGNVKALKAGTAVVSVTAGGASDYCQITVADTVQSASDDEVKADGYIYHEDFTDRNAVPGYLRTSISGGGTMSVANGEMSLSTAGTGKAFATYTFEDTLSGKIVAETRVRVASRSFSNILFFYKGEQGYSNDDIIACLGMDAGQFKNHNGGGWGNIGKSYTVGTWYEIRMELDIGAGRYDLVIDGQRFSRLPFRKTGDGVEDRIKLLKFGTDKENAGLNYDYIRVSQGSDKTLPEIEASRTVYNISIEKTNTVVLDYRVEGNPKPAVTLIPDASNPSGATVSSDNRTVTFESNATGTYNFIIEAENSEGKVQKTVTVVVREHDNILLDTDFSSKPAGMVLVANGGESKVEDGRLIMTTGSSGSVLTSAMYDFGEALTGKVRVTTTVTVGTNAFSNILFIYHPGVNSFDRNSCTNSIAVENGMLKYNNGSWTPIEAITLGTAFKLEVLFDFDSHTFDLWLNDAKKLTGAKMRKTTGESGVLLIGSDKPNTEMIYDSMCFVKEEQ